MISASPGLRAAADLLARARTTRDNLASRMLVAAAIEQVAMTIGARAILTGGTAVDFYASHAFGTSEGYPVKWRPSADVDIVVMKVEGPGDPRAGMIDALVKLGLKPRWFGDTARIIDIPDYPFTLEIVGDELNRDPEAKHVLTVLLDDRWPVTLRGPEDVILAYAESGLHMRHRGDWERALGVYEAMRDRLDMAWMVEEAKRRGQSRALDLVTALTPTPWNPEGR